MKGVIKQVPHGINDHSHRRNFVVTYSYLQETNKQKTKGFGKLHAFYTNEISPFVLLYELIIDDGDTLSFAFQALFCALKIEHLHPYKISTI